MVEAEDGTDAFESVRGEPPELLLMDIHLPVMDGREATRLIREDFAGELLPIISYSGAAFSEDRQRALASGALAYIVKPEINDLAKTVRLLLLG